MVLLWFYNCLLWCIDCALLFTIFLLWFYYGLQWGVDHALARGLYWQLLRVETSTFITWIECPDNDVQGDFFYWSPPKFGRVPDPM